MIINNKVEDFRTHCSKKHDESSENYNIATSVGIHTLLNIDKLKQQKSTLFTTQTQAMCLHVLPTYYNDVDLHTNLPILLNRDGTFHPINTITTFFHSEYNNESDSDFSSITLACFSPQITNMNIVDCFLARREEKLKQNFIFFFNNSSTDSSLPSSSTSNQIFCLEFNIEFTLPLDLQSVLKFQRVSNSETITSILIYSKVLALPASALKLCHPVKHQQGIWIRASLTILYNNYGTLDTSKISLLSPPPTTIQFKSTFSQLHHRFQFFFPPTILPSLY